MRLLWLAPVHYDPSQDVHPAPWISSLARKLVDERGLSLTILNYEPRLPEEEISFEKEGIRYVFLKTPVPKMDHIGFFRRRISILRAYMLKHQGEFDLIHVHGSEHQYEAAVVDVDLPHVLSMQGVIGECLKRLKDRWNYTHLSWWMSSQYERRYLPRLSDFICRTTFDSGFVNEVNPTAMIHENWEMIRPTFFQDLGSDSPDCLMYMGGTHPIKGIEHLLPAIDMVRKKHDIRLKILGKVDMSKIEEIFSEKQFAYLGMSDIDFLGFQDVDGVVNAMNESFAMVHTSLIDNSPNSVCEAQVAGLPVVSTNVGGISSLITHGETGLLSMLQPADIARQIFRLIDEPGLHAKLKAESRRVARSRHNAQVIVDQTIAIYEAILSRSERKLAG